VTRNAALKLVVGTKGETQMTLGRPERESESAAEVITAFSKVGKSYDRQHWVVENLDLDIRHGEFLTLLGPSGSGKTTTLMMLAGFEYPDCGHIHLNGKAIEHLPPERRDIGVVFQNYALFPHMTVAENIGFPLRVRRMPKAEAMQRVAAALDMVRLSNLADRRPTQLSGGQQQRVALARALVFEPKLVLMDEPLGALDKQLREELQLEIKRIQRRLGLTILYVTHDQSEALTMSDRIAVFNAGRIQQIDRPKVIYDAPATSFVASFIGDNNAIDGSVVETDGRIAKIRLPDGTMIEAMATKHAVKGAAVSLAIRPERIYLAPPADCRTRLSGTITEVIYVGEQTRLAIALPYGQIVKVRITNAQSWVDPEPGARVEFGWHLEDCFALDAVHRS
jgi:putative spermidine/putrescine transport system ATP-binding protein